MAETAPATTAVADTATAPAVAETATAPRMAIVFTSPAWAAMWTHLSFELSIIMGEQEKIIVWAREHITRLVNAACAGHMTLHEEHIHAFGSRLHGICLPNSDLDMVMHLPPKQEVCMPGDKILAVLYEHMLAVNYHGIPRESIKDCIGGKWTLGFDIHGLHIDLTYQHGAIHEFLGLRTSHATIRTLSDIVPRGRQAIKLLIDWGKAERVVYHREHRMGLVRENLKAIHVVLFAALFLKRACLDRNSSTAQFLRFLFHEFAASRFEELVFDVDKQEIRNRSEHAPPFVLNVHNRNPVAQVPMRILQMWRSKIASLLDANWDEYSAARREAWATMATTLNTNAIAAPLQRCSVPATSPPAWSAATAGPSVQIPRSAGTAGPPPPPPPPPPTTPPPPPTSPPPPTTPPQAPPQPVDVNVVEQMTGTQLVDLTEGMHTFLGGHIGSIKYSIQGRPSQGFVIWLPGCDGGRIMTRDMQRSGILEKVAIVMPEFHPPHSKGNAWKVRPPGFLQAFCEAVFQRARGHRLTCALLGLSRGSFWASHFARNADYDAVALIGWYPEPGETESNSLAHGCLLRPRVFLLQSRGDTASTWKRAESFCLGLQTKAKNVVCIVDDASHTGIFDACTLAPGPALPYGKRLWQFLVPSLGL